MLALVSYKRQKKEEVSFWTFQPILTWESCSCVLVIFNRRCSSIRACQRCAAPADDACHRHARLQLRRVGGVLSPLVAGADVAAVQFRRAALHFRAVEARVGAQPRCQGAPHVHVELERVPRLGSQRAAGVHHQRRRRQGDPHGPPRRPAAERQRSASTLMRLVSTSSRSHGFQLQILASTNFIRFYFVFFFERKRATERWQRRNARLSGSSVAARQWRTPRWEKQGWTS
jgi:hypothetical protein